MSSLKTDGKAKERSALNTTINKEIFDEFKKSCKKSGVPMNTLIETFMRQYNEGGFYLKFTKEKQVEAADIVDESDEAIALKDNFGEVL